MHLRSWLDGLRTKLTGGTSVMRRRRTRVSRRMVEALEDRTLLSCVTGAIVTEHRLEVCAHAGENLVIREDLQDPGQVQLLVGGVPYTSIPPTLTTSSLMSIEIIAGEGDNLIDLSGINSLVFSVLESISVDAGEGDDQVIASADFDDVIVENVFTTDMAKFLEASSHRSSIYTKNFPTGSWLEVKGLALPEFMIGIELEAHRSQ